MKLIQQMSESARTLQSTKATVGMLHSSATFLIWVHWMLLLCIRTSTRPRTKASSTGGNYFYLNWSLCKDHINSNVVHNSTVSCFSIGNSHQKRGNCGVCISPDKKRCKIRCSKCQAFTCKENLVQVCFHCCQWVIIFYFAFLVINKRELFLIY